MSSHERARSASRSALNHNFVVTLVDSSSPLAGRREPRDCSLAGDAGFSECAGLEMSMQPEEYKEGGRNGAVLKFPNRVTWTNLTLKRGAAPDQRALGLALRLRHGIAGGVGTASSRCSMPRIGL